MTIYRETRELLLNIFSPILYLVILLPLLSFSADVSPLLFLFLFSLTITFFYLFISRSVDSIQSKLSNRKGTSPKTNGYYEGSTYFERFVNISHEALFGDEIEIEPITEYTARSLFPYLVYSFWGFVGSCVMFLFSASGLAWLVSIGNIESLADIPVSEDAIHNAPLGLVDFLLALFPIFNRLSFEEQVVTGGVVFMTGFVFLTTARNLTEVSGDIHRRILRTLVCKNPIIKNELINTLLLLSIYGIVFSLM
ncbi:hypothetical protein [Natrinema thermotolerans]